MFYSSLSRPSAVQKKNFIAISSILAGESRVGLPPPFIARTYYLNLIYFCRKYTIFTKFYEFMLQKVLKFANYAVAGLV